MNAVANQDPSCACSTAEYQPVAAQYVTPAVDISETAEGYVLTVELPGVTREGLDITLEGNELTIVGRRAQDGIKGQTLYRESANADFRRVFELDPAIDGGKIGAKIDQGILTVQLPKSERIKPRKVAIND